MRKIYFFLVTFMCITSKVAHSSEHFSDHEQFCLQQPEKECLTYINEVIEQSALHSTQWYKAKSYLFDYYYDKNDYASLKLVVEPFADRNDLPKVFKVQTYFYYAKMLRYYNDNERAKVYATKAFNDIQQMYESFSDPMRILELANLQYVFGNKETAFQMLLKTERKFGKSKDPIFNFELHSNKANAYHALGDLENARKSRKQALDWIYPTQHQNKIIVAQGNLARTYQLLSEYKQANKYYVAALGNMVTPSDDIIKATYKLRLAQVNWQAADNEQAIKWLAAVDHAYLRPHHLTLYNQLKATLQQH
ncbi:hypothetical protein CWB85_00580 [Pseudoalteromonas sp. S1727]|nr:hypothetical protein CWB85_00580 [Pseudoalteromonas sp. S1727]